ncbi:hypothetical protein L9F63_000193, partial [Diploptera punctata]
YFLFFLSLYLLHFPELILNWRSFYRNLLKTAAPNIKFAITFIWYMFILSMTPTTLHSNLTKNMNEFLSLTTMLFLFPLLLPFFPK